MNRFILHEFMIKNSTFFLMALFFFMIGYWQFIKPNIARYNALVAEESRLRLEFETKQQLANRRAYQKQTVKLLEHYHEKRKILASDQEIKALINQLMNTAVKKGLTVVNFTPKSIIKHEFYREEPIDMIIIGEYYQLILFLNQITTWDRLVNFNNFALGKLDIKGLKTTMDSEMDMLLRIEITVIIYLQ